METILKDNRTAVLGIVAMAIVVVSSNILVQFYFGSFLTYGAFTYPLAFLVNDIINRLEGPRTARKVIFWGFIVGVFCSFLGSQLQGEFGPLVTMRIALGSGVAFLLAHLTDITIFNKFRNLVWWLPPLLSSFLGSIIDTFTFFYIAFSSSLSFIEPSNDTSWANEKTLLLNTFSIDTPFWVSLALADLMVKFSLALIFLIPFRHITLRYHRERI
jgi:uncharacterized integral membrane protein (TIGR00697 family)